MSESLALARRPTSGTWQRHPDLRLQPPSGVVLVFSHRSGARVLSAVELVLAEDGTTTREWHVSVSFNGGIADNLVTAMVLRDFGMDGAFEDNHQPGVVRNFWLAVDPADRKPQCSCVGNEAEHEQGCRVWRDAPETVTP